MSGVVSEVSLKYLCVCNISFGQKEGEEEKKILYYFPKGTDMEIQVKEIGLCQAIIKFSQTFSSDPCESVFTGKTKRVLYEAEPDCWFIMGVNGGRRVEALKSVLVQCYESVRLFLGPLDRLGSRCVQSLDPLLTKYLMSTVVSKLVTRTPCQVFRGLNFLPLDRADFLQVLSVVNSIESALPDIHYSLILHNDSIVWSGLPAEDTQVVFRYLTVSLLPSFLAQEKQSKSPLDPDSYGYSGRFVCGPKSQNDLVNVRRLPKLYLHSCVQSGSVQQDCGFYRMIVYRLPLTTLAWFIRLDADPSMQLFRSLDKVCREDMAAVVDSIKLDADEGPGVGVGSSLTDSDIRYVYFNSMNLAVKTQPTRQGHVSGLVLSLHSHNDRLVQEGCMFVETIAKTSKDNWVCARSSNHRHCFLSSDKKHYSMDDFSKQVNRICDKKMSTIFFRV